MLCEEWQAEIGNLAQLYGSFGAKRTCERVGAGYALSPVRASELGTVARCHHADRRAVDITSSQPPSLVPDVLGPSIDDDCP